MEDMKWLFKKYVFLLVFAVIIVIISSIVLGRRGSERRAEEVWEPLVVVESKDFGAEDEVKVESVEEDSMESTEEISIWKSTAPVSVSDDINMENYQKMEEFYSVYLSGGDAMVIVFDVRKDGNIGALTFIHRNGKIQTYYVTVGWQEGGIPEIKDYGCSDLETIRLLRI